MFKLASPILAALLWLIGTAYEAGQIVSRIDAVASSVTQVRQDLHDHIQESRENYRRNQSERNDDLLVCKKGAHCGDNSR